MPAEIPAAFVVVTHLDPARANRTVEALVPHTDLLVEAAGDRCALAPGRVFILPSDNRLRVQGGTLRSIGSDPPSRRAPIDAFLRSLSEDLGSRAACVILSGNGTDGTLGLRSIKEAGGLALVQDPASATFDGMPRSAAASGFADRVVSLDQVAELLETYQAAVASSLPWEASEVEGLAAGPLEAILESVRSRTGKDFGEYKRGTLERRIVQRIRKISSPSPECYARRVQEDPEESLALFQDFLVGVTQFFRDPDAFETLAHGAIADLVERPGGPRPIRIWVPGCSTGEEAYTLAILFAEASLGGRLDTLVQIFATDLNGMAIDTARQGTFPQGIEIDVSPDRLHRFFRRREGLYQVVDRIREVCIFSVHDVTRDPPLSRIDLISCRNLLMYLEPDVQRRLLPMFRFALNPGGYLVLGRVEGIPLAEAAFRTVDVRSRIFQRCDPDGSAAASPPILPSGPHGAPAPASAPPPVPVEDLDKEPEPGPPGASAEPARKIAALSRELRTIRRRLQDTCEAHEEAMQDQRAANEELQAMNEELQSANEELETTRFELQSMNEDLQLRVRSAAASKSNLETLLSAAGVAILHLDGGLRVRNFSQAVTETFHLRDTDRGRSITDIRHHLLDPYLVDRFRAALRTGTPATEVGRCDDGRALEVRLQPEDPGEAGQKGLIVSLVDVGRLQRAEQELAALREGLERGPEARSRSLASRAKLLEALVNAAPIPLLTCDGAGRIGEFSAAAAHLFAYQPDEVRGLGLEEIFAPVAAEAGTTALPATLEVLEAHARRPTSRLRGRRRDGTSFPVRVRMAPMSGADDEGRVLVVSEVPEGPPQVPRTVAVDLQAAALGDRLLRAFDDLELGILVVEPEGDADGAGTDFRLRLVNAAAVDLIGGTKELLLDHLLADVLPEFGTEGMRDLLRQVASGGLGTRLGPSRRRFRGDDIERWWETHVFPVPGGQAGIALHDVTEAQEVALTSRRRASDLAEAVEAQTEELKLAANRVREEVAERENLEERLEHAGRLASIGTLAAGVAHEINNPAAYLAANLAVLRRLVSRLALEEASPGLPGEVASILDDCAEGVRRIALIVGELSNFSRSAPSSFCATDLRDVARTAAHLTDGEFKSAASLELQLDEVPPVEADPNRLVQVVVNLLINAAHALTAAAAPDPRVLVRTFTRRGEVVLQVSDTGPGVAAELRERIFDPYFTTKPAGSGTGLGLPLAAEIARWHGGEVHLVSGPEEGGCFELVLPAMEAPPGEGMGTETRPEEGALPPGTRVLVVDDDVLVLRGFQRLIEDLAEVVTIESGAGALRALAGGAQFDLILCDLMMPGMTGLEFLSSLESAHPELAGRVLFLSGGGMSPETRAFAEEDPERVLVKPLSRADLIPAMLKVLEQEAATQGVPPPARRDA